MDTYKVTKLTVDMDLSETSMQAALALINYKTLDLDNAVLIVGKHSDNVSPVAGRVAEKYKIRTVIINPLMEWDEWAVQVGGELVYSFGA